MMSLARTLSTLKFQNMINETNSKIFGREGPGITKQQTEEERRSKWALNRKGADGLSFES